ncbi:MAG: ATP-dependent RecD-like DNA helicase [Clostridia bacterium]|nr:ATP-dependent RecD-like DNA helicase [Clostridia bacterium]
MAEPIRECVSGVVETVVYRNERNDYAVIELTGDDDSMITATGILPYVAEGEEVILYGRWVTHAAYGRQFSVETFEKRLPSDVHAILRYLASGAVRGVGPSTATKIVSRFGEDSFDVIENHPEWLSDIPGISVKKAAAISESFREQTGVRAVMMFCRDFVGAATATRVYKRFGAGAVGKIRENPYCLCDGTLGIGFEKADEIAASLGMDKNAACRLESGLRYVLQYNAMANGHTCLPADKLTASTTALLGVEQDTVLAALDAALNSGKLVSHPAEGFEETPLIFLEEAASAEDYVARKLLLLDRYCATYSHEDVERMIGMVEAEQGIRYAEQQRHAIHAAMTGGVLIVTGGPGTGKTTVVMALLRIFEHLGCQVALAAPTGRAAKRMSEAGGHEARTIHRMLEMERTAEEGELRFNRNERNPLDENVIIIDEASMLDLPLAAGLLRAVQNGTRLILIGDVDQLPSVGMGNVLGDLLDCGVFSTVCLSEIFRQSERSLIVTNAHRINRGEMPRLDETDGDFFFVERNVEEQIALTVAALIETRLPRVYGEEMRDKIQVITPSRKGRAGTEVLNRLLQERINPAEIGKDEIRFRDAAFRIGDRVMQIRNNYEIEWEKNGKQGNGIFNGDIGVIERIEKQSETLWIRYDDRLATYDFSLLEELEHAYAITVHKSQGSEYPVVILPMYACAPPLLTRNLIYTAVTRAREMVVLVGRKDIVARMVENNRHDMRYTCLHHRILKAAKDYENI